MGVGRAGKGSVMPGGRPGNRSWVGARRLGAGRNHGRSTAVEESQVFHSDLSICST